MRFSTHVGCFAGLRRDVVMVRVVVSASVVVVTGDVVVSSGVVVCSVSSGVVACSGVVVSSGVVASSGVVVSSGVVASSGVVMSGGVVVCSDVVVSGGVVVCSGVVVSGSGSGVTSGTVSPRPHTATARQARAGLESAKRQRQLITTRTVVGKQSSQPNPKTTADRRPGWHQPEHNFKWHS